MSARSLLVLPGDGVGPEVMAEALRVLAQVQARADLEVMIEHDLVGGAAIDAHGVPLTEATLGAPDPDGRRAALYEPIHGSAPDIAGMGVANPLAQILSLAMLLRWSFGLEDQALAVERACVLALAGGARTPDLGGVLTTRQMGDAVLAGL